MIFTSGNFAIASDLLNDRNDKILESFMLQNFKFNAPMDALARLKPSEAYLDVGFENLLHFCYAFKQTFGVNPSAIWLTGVIMSNQGF